MAAMRFEQLERFILAKKYFGVRGTLTNDSSTCKKDGARASSLISPHPGPENALKSRE